MPASTRSTRRTTLGPVSYNRKRESMPGAFSSIDHGNNQTKMKKKSTRSRMSMAPRVASGHYKSSFTTNKTVNINDEKHETGTLPIKKSSGGLEPKTPSRRKSMGHALHHQSQYSHHSSTNTRTDPRPINEKQYQNSCIRTIHQYLVSSGYSHAISPKILSRPSGKDFHQIVTFLLRRVDPTFTNDNSSMKFEEEVAIAFKGLGYPFPISKTALVAAGSIHTWPALLAALTWLIELLSCKEAIPGEDSDDEDVTNDEKNEDKENNYPIGTLDTIHIKTEKRFFRYLAKSYEAFLSSNDDQYDVLEEQFLDDFERDNMKIEKEIERATDGNAEILEEIDEMARNSLTLPELETKREDLCTDLEKFHTLVNKYQEHKAALEQKVHDRDMEYKQTQHEVQITKGNVASLKEKIQTQDFSVNDVRKMETERARMKEKLERAGQNKQSHQKHIWENEFELKKELKELYLVAHQYNKMAKSSLKEDYFYVSINEDALNEGNQSTFLGVDVKNSVIPMLHELKSDYENKKLQASGKYEEVLRILETSEKSIAELTESVKVSMHKNVCF